MAAVAVRLEELCVFGGDCVQATSLDLLHEAVLLKPLLKNLGCRRDVDRGVLAAEVNHDIRISSEAEELRSLSAEVYQDLLEPRITYAVAGGIST